ncbi:MAG: uracil phosphoribosyltransferase [Ignavibacteria bacterium]|nr:uracil phosphoribosyltransferase [Ignavibacteria bacterium]
MTTILSGTALSHDLAIIRSRDTHVDVFRAAVHRIGLHIAAETLKYLPSKQHHVDTPLETTTVDVIDGNVVVVPILRAGMGLLEPFLALCPGASVGFIGLKRNEETLQPNEYYRNLPPSDASTTFIVIDPMLATGGSMVATLDLLRPLPHQRLLVACLIGAPEGVHAVDDAHPDAHIIIAALDRELNDVGYIVPGLGDAGDRLFGTT